VGARGPAQRNFAQLATVCALLKGPYMRTLIVALGLLAFTTPALAGKRAAHKTHKASKHAKAKTKASHKRHADLDRSLMKPTWL